MGEWPIFFQKQYYSTLICNLYITNRLKNVKRTQKKTIYCSINNYDTLACEDSHI